MKFRKNKFIAILFIGVLFIQSCKETTPQITPIAVDANKLFVFEVYPLLESKCFTCHGDDPDEIEGEFTMLSLSEMLKGGESGKPAIIPKQASKSPLYLAATRVEEDFAMPPKVNDKLNEDQLDALKNWIDAGAPWPEEKERNEILAEGGWDFKGRISVETSGGESKSWTTRKYKPEDLWAYYPLRKVKIPEVIGNNSTNPIDAFIRQRLNDYKIKPADKADKRTLIRRATFDLHGLPPTSEEIENFITDESPDAFDKVIERLLASPHYGEQWGRHWLDVVRYADSDGLANDYSRPNAWRYRDYVIRSFNEDKPYSQFVQEQIAGDEIDPNNPEMLVATGFLRMGPWEHTGMSREAETRQFFLDDVSNSVGEVFLAQPLGCARCHDHKFDPVPTKDVYSIQAVFATTQFSERPAPFLEKENLSLIQKEKQRLLSELEYAKSEQKAMQDKEVEALKKWFAEKNRPYLPKKIWRKLPENQQPPLYLGLTNTDLGYRKLLNKRKQRFTKEISASQPLAFSVYNGPKRIVHSQNIFKIPKILEGPPEESYILTGGSVYAPSEKVSPGRLSVLSTLQDTLNDGSRKETLDLDIPNTIENRRLAFSKWMIHPDNPLITRTIVNRIWQYHFGKGIAENTNNFGATGSKPTHPELLDWLANNFIENGWSMKHIHRLILSSETWQRSGKHPNLNKIKSIDPDNQLLAVFSPRRLDSEEIRDAILSSTGELNKEAGGIPVRPEIHLEIALQPRQIMGSIAPAYQPSSTRGERNKRTIYTLRLRGLSDPLLEVFNQPGSDLSCEKRSNSTVSPQVFMLFNDKNIRERGIALAKQLTDKYTDKTTLVQNIYSKVLNRSPNKSEIKDSKLFLDEMVEYHVNNTIPKESIPKEVQREMFEEMTGEVFSFKERLNVYEDYEFDLKMEDVDSETRALTDLAIVLFNSNEFMYVY